MKKSIKFIILSFLLCLSFSFREFKILAMINQSIIDENSMEITLPEQEEYVQFNSYAQMRAVNIPITNEVTRTTAESGRWIWPTAEYYPVICTYLCYDYHHAIDIYAVTGTPVYASRDGVVQQVVNSCPNMSKNQKECGGGYGNYITIKHSSGVYSRYAHLNSVSVSVGQKVNAGSQIGTIGTSGRVGAAHLHFEIRQNTRGMALGGWDPLDKSRFYYVLPREKNYSKVGWNYVNGNWYYYVNGKKHTGWKEMDNKWYYMNNVGIRQTGFQNINNKYYYFDKSGIMQTGWQNINNKYYYFNKSGVMQTGWLDVDNKWYYLDKSGARQTGWQLINNKWYYFNNSGVMQTNTIIGGWEIDNNGVATKVQTNKNGWVKSGNTWYYYINGKQQTGWLKENKDWYYLNSNGSMHLGWKFVDSNWYFFNDYGRMVTNTTIDGWKIDSNGVGTKIKFTGWKKENNKWYYYVNGDKKTGWLKDQNKWYYLDSNGRMLSNEWIKINGSSYYLQSDGIMATGWKQWRHQWYFFDNSGIMLNKGTKDGWIITSSGMAYQSGKMNPDYVVNKSISRLVKLDYNFNENLNSNNAKSVILSGTPGYEEALTEAVVVEVMKNKATQFNVYLLGNKAYVFYK